MKKFLALWSLFTLRLAAADVSHLGIKYLPPMMMSNNGFQRNHGNMQNGLSKPMTTTTIEKQYLRELPVQIEYGTQDDSQYGSHMMPMTNNEMNMMMMMMMMKPNMKMPHDASKMMPTPAEYMLPPPMEQSVMPLYNEPERLYLPPNMNYAPTWQEQQQQQEQQQPQHSMTSMPRTQYLPPTFMQQSQYQQRQEMQHLPQMTQMTQMTQMHTAPMLAKEMPVIERQQMMEYTQNEPHPAHMLTSNGYQYKTATSFPTPRMSSSPVANKQLFHLRQ